MGNDIRDSTGTIDENNSSLKLSVYSIFISKLDKTRKEIYIYKELSPALLTMSRPLG